MGAVSSCCAVEESEEKQIVKEGKSQSKSSNRESSKESKKSELKSEKKSPPPQSPAPAPTHKLDPEGLKAKLLNGMGVLVLLQDGTKLACILHLNADNSLSISCEDKVRMIPLADIKALLHTKDQLRRVETRANLVDDENCVALHLLESGNCIPLRFDDVNDKLSFVEMVKNIKG